MDSLYTQPYAYFSLSSPGESLLSPGCGLVAWQSGQVMLVDWSQQLFLGSAQFTEKQFPLLIALLASWPYYRSYAHMLGLLTNEPEQSITQRLDIQRLDPLQAEAFQMALAPVREELKGLQQHLASFGLRIFAVYECGYRLCSLPPPFTSQQSGKSISSAHYAEQQAMEEASSL